MLFARKNTNHEITQLHSLLLWQAFVCGAVIGLLSGAVGIGGGIFLSPLIILTKWGTSKQAAAIAAGFIVLNSASGLLGRLFNGNLVLGLFSVALLPFIFSEPSGVHTWARLFSLHNG